MPRRPLVMGLLAVALVTSSIVCVPRAADAECQVTVPLKAVPGLYEASGLAVSRSEPARLFTINDSSRPEVLVLGLDGSPRGRVRLAGATVIDWEDVTTAPCADGNCLYVSDIGDNNHARRSIALYRVPEPPDGERQATAVRIEAVFPDGPRDAEAVFAGPGGRLYLVTKESPGAAVYAFPETLQIDGLNRLERLARLDSGVRGALSWVTDAEASADGQTVAVRSNDALILIPTPALLAGRMTEAQWFSLRRLGEPQGEGVALGPGREVFVAGEGGRRLDAGTFARLTCPAP